MGDDEKYEYNWKNYVNEIKKYFDNKPYECSYEIMYRSIYNICNMKGYMDKLKEDLIKILNDYNDVVTDKSIEDINCTLIYLKRKCGFVLDRSLLNK